MKHLHSSQKKLSPYRNWVISAYSLTLWGLECEILCYSPILFKNTNIERYHHHSKKRSLNSNYSKRYHRNSFQSIDFVSKLKALTPTSGFELMLTRSKLNQIDFDSKWVHATMNLNLRFRLWNSIYINISGNRIWHQVRTMSTWIHLPDASSFRSQDIFHSIPSKSKLKSISISTLVWL